MKTKSSTKRPPVLVIHGGAMPVPMGSARYPLYQASLERILKEVYPFLKKGGSALHAVIRAAELLEDDPLYNAGKGSKIQSDGKIRMSASVMDGATRRFAGCVNVRKVKNPVRLAEALLEREDRVLAEQGGETLAREIGLEFSSPYTPHARKAYKERREGKYGTIGAIALDRKGRLAAATSTGGRGFEYPHRVSDSPTAAGNFANEVCAVSATGPGERIVEFSAASAICTMVDVGIPLTKAVTRLLDKASSHSATFGVIALDRNGKFEAQTTTDGLIWAAANDRGLRFFHQEFN